MDMPCVRSTTEALTIHPLRWRFISLSPGARPCQPCAAFAYTSLRNKRPSPAPIPRRMTYRHPPVHDMPPHLSIPQRRCGISSHFGPRSPLTSEQHRTCQPRHALRPERQQGFPLASHTVSAMLAVLCGDLVVWIPTCACLSARNDMRCDMEQKKTSLQVFFPPASRISLLLLSQPPAELPACLITGKRFSTMVVTNNEMIRLPRQLTRTKDITQNP